MGTFRSMKVLPLLGASDGEDVKSPAFVDSINELMATTQAGVLLNIKELCCARKKEMNYLAKLCVILAVCQSLQIRLSGEV